MIRWYFSKPLFTPFDALIVVIGSAVASDHGSLWSCAATIPLFILSAMLQDAVK